MTFRVVFSEQASRELEAAADWWAEHRSQDEAARWYAGFSDRIYSLRENPDRCSLSDENDEFPYPIRELHYGLSSRPTHRAIFTIISDQVVVLAIRHSARDRITPDDVDDPTG